jgi:hypothetical protein
MCNFANGVSRTSHKPQITTILSPSTTAYVGTCRPLGAKAADHGGRRCPVMSQFEPLRPQPLHQEQIKGPILVTMPELSAKSHLKWTPAYGDMTKEGGMMAPNTFLILTPSWDSRMDLLYLIVMSTLRHTLEQGGLVLLSTAARETSPHTIMTHFGLLTAHQRR